MATATTLPPPSTTYRGHSSAFPGPREAGSPPTVTVLSPLPGKPRRSRSQPRQQQDQPLALPSRRTTGDFFSPAQPNQVRPLQDSSNISSNINNDSSSSLTDSRIAADRSLREYIDLLQRRQVGRYNAEPGLEEQLHVRAKLALRDLSVLKKKVTALAQKAKGRKWRRWFLGGVIGSIIPAVRAFFNRPSKYDVGQGRTLNRTEYAFRESKRLLRRFTDAARGRGGLASLGFIVFAVLYIFQNEVILRVAKTVSKRLRRLGNKIKTGWEDVDEADAAVLEGWRWRVLKWAN